MNNEGSWPAGTSAMAARVRAHDWAATPLGIPARWSPSLTAAVRLVLNARHPMAVWWGPRLVQFYNDAYRDAAGPDRLEAALGASAHHTWADVWPLLGPQVEQVMAGQGASWQEDQLVPDIDQGQPRDRYWSYSVSAVDDDGAPNGVGGVLVVCRETTDAVLARRAGEERYRTLLQSMDLGYLLADVTFDARGQAVDIACVEANSAAARMLCTPLVGRRLSEIDAQYEPYWYEIFGRVARTGQGERLERPAAVQRRWYDFYVFKPDADTQRSRQVAVVFQDITERKRVEAALQDSEARLAAIVAQASVGLSQISIDGRFVMVNDELCRMLGRSREELLQAGVPEVTLAADVAASLEAVARVLRTGHPVSVNKRYVRRDGTLIHASSCLSPLIEDGRTGGILAVTMDLTERVRAEAALRASEQRYRLLVESAKDYAIVGMDAAGAITSWNIGAERLIGYPEAEALGQPAALCFTPEDRAAGAPEQELAAARLRGRAENERWHQRKDGSRFWGSGFVVPQAGDPHLGFLKILRDRTAEQLTKREREALVAALREADRRKDEFLATLAHELRNPLAPLRNVVSLLKRSDPSPQQAPLVAIMERQIGQLRRLVDDLLEVSRITQGKITLKRAPMTVGSAVYAALEAIQPLIEQRRQVLDVHVRSRAIVDIDAARITQIITNLLNNAAKFTPEGGRIRLEAFDRDGQARVCVHDEGIGIAPELLPQVFELFAQGAATTDDQAHGGLGIGLSLVKRLVELHGGSVSAESRGVGQGATFTIALPETGTPADAP